MHARFRTRLLAAFVILPALFGPAVAQDASELVVRLGRLESQSRTMSGQIETLQYENRQLKEQLRKFQEDVEFRLNEKSGGGAPAAKPARSSSPSATPAPAAPGAINGGNPGFNPAPARSQPQKRGDAFDPEQNPDAPGAPMRLGATEPSAPLPQRETAEAAPLPRGAIDDEGDASGSYDEPVDLNPPRRTGAIPAVAPRPSESVAATGTPDAGADYDAAVEMIQSRQFEQAEMSLRQFLQSHPRDARVPGATYWLGESYLARGRTREAAEQFLKVSTDYARSAQAPEAMLKLSVSLNALGAKEQACATLAELERKFPNAATGVRQGVTREQKRPLRGVTGADDPLLDALRPWLRPERAHGILLAVSGGPDSTALMHAAAIVSPALPLSVATVDHGLRPEAAAEAASVGQAASDLGLLHATLRWEGDKPATGLQDAARDARYRLLAAHAAAIGADLILTAHTRDDQAETVLMRLAAGSALAGLAGMRTERLLAPGLRLGRPFLGLDKAILVGWCEARGLSFLRDPSNTNPRFARTRLRTAAAALAAEGLTSARLARLAERAARDEAAALRQAAERALADATLPAPAGILRLDGMRLCAEPEAVALRCVDLGFTRAGGCGYRLEKLEALVFGGLLPALRAGATLRRTLAGYCVSADAGRRVTIEPAPPRKNAGPAAPTPDLLGNEDPPPTLAERERTGWRCCARANLGTARAKD